MALERFQLNSPGMREILRSDGVQQLLQAKAGKVKAQVDAELAGEGLNIIADTQVGRNRAGATVIGVPMRIEADRRILGRAIDAAR